jgi:hypothetical protein
LPAPGDAHKLWSVAMSRLNLLALVLVAAACSQKTDSPPANGRPEALPRGASAAAPDRGGPVVNLPRRFGVWTRPDAPRRITAETIFDYMDGGGELYLGYRFDHLDVFEYKADDPSRGTVLVELYLMRTSDDAYGLLSTDWGGEPVDAGASRAVYGAGLLRAWSGDLYMRILASRETPQSRDAVLALARAAAAGRPQPPAPRITTALPAEAPLAAAQGSPAVSGAFVLRPDRTCFFRSYLVLNSAYFLASQDILGLGPQVDGVTSEYRGRGASSGSARLVLVRYPTPDAARAALTKFVEAFVTERPEHAPAVQGQVKLEHGWLAWSTAGAALAIVFDAPTGGMAATLARMAAENR